MTKPGENWQRDERVEWFRSIVELHDTIIETYGGAKGLIDSRLLEAALERPFMGLANGTELFPSDVEKAAALLEGIILFHPFVDGNKRTATIFTFQFLKEHFYTIETVNEEIVEFVTKIATKELQFNDIKEWIAHRVSKTGGDS